MRFAAENLENLVILKQRFKDGACVCHCELQLLKCLCECGLNCRLKGWQQCKGHIKRTKYEEM